MSSSFQYSLNNKPTKNINNFVYNEFEYNSENHHQLTNLIGNISHVRKYQRTVSESSNESNSNYGLLALNKNSIISTKNRHYKPLLFNFLRRLNNEKLLFIANNSTIGLFSRLPFKSNLSK